MLPSADSPDVGGRLHQQPHAVQAAAGGRVVQREGSTGGPLHRGHHLHGGGMGRVQMRQVSGLVVPGAPHCHSVDGGEKERKTRYWLEGG